jgi:hypothetical protein
MAGRQDFACLAGVNASNVAMNRTVDVATSYSVVNAWYDSVNTDTEPQFANPCANASSAAAGQRVLLLQEATFTTRITPQMALLQSGGRAGTGLQPPRGAANVAGAGAGAGSGELLLDPRLGLGMRALQGGAASQQQGVLLYFNVYAVVSSAANESDSQYAARLQAEAVRIQAAVLALGAVTTTVNQQRREVALEAALPSLLAALTALTGLTPAELLVALQV